MLLNVGLGVEIVGSVGSVGLSSLQAENRITPISITAYQKEKGKNRHMKVF
jgi:hypothetical protein